ncbi:SAF domain-containing protein [Luteimicrobium subarcticum]|uniref:Flp pilus assembly protein CpaB n=1 Tax=Luteimicrobium subarcticum TaxID=620910 RepID=A0A2M8WSW6_9MICO|nr:SAF domain-containing protein [Luteimicrobium subarcticum]PJI94045.1 Flp pilus assembly protein CpaB [Luteimicrobium subarcticum]
MPLDRDLPPHDSPDTARRRDDRRLAFRRALWRCRVLVVALCCGLAATVVVHALRPAPLPTVPVVVTARDVPAGHRLTGADLRVARVPAALAPTVSLRAERSARGRVTGVALPAGTVVVPSVVAAGELTSVAPAGRVVVAVPLDASARGIVSPGVRVDLLAPGVTGAAYVARDALVLAGSGHAGAGGSAASGADADDSGTPAVVALRPEEAEALAGLPDGSRLTAALVP